MRLSGFKYGCKAVTLLLLASCGYAPATATVTQAMSVNGFLVFPPESGALALIANVDGQEQQIASALVQKDGAFTVDLPAQVTLPKQANIQDIPVQPELKPLNAQNFKCDHQVQASNQQARVVLLNAGRFMTKSGKVLGEAVPGTMAVAGTKAQFSTYVYAFADRAVHVGGHLDCHYSENGQMYKASINVAYNLKPGWNVLLRKSVRNSQSNEVKTVASTLANSPVMNWRYQVIQE